MSDIVSPVSHKILPTNVRAPDATRLTLAFRRRVPNDAAAILALLAGHREQLVGVVVESTYNWYWLVDALQSRQHLCEALADGNSHGEGGPGPTH